MQRAQDMIIGAGIVGGMIGAVIGGALWIINPDIDGNAAAFFGILAAAIVFTVLYRGWARPENPKPTGPRDLSPDPMDMPGAGTRAQKLSIGAEAQSAPAPAAAAPAPAPAPTAPASAGDDAPGKPDPAGEQTRPAGLDAPRDGAPDDLKKIKGVGPKLEALVNSMGFYHFDQIAGWSDTEIAWVDENLEGFKGRVTRDEWVAQARILASGGSTEFSERQ